MNKFYTVCKTCKSYKKINTKKMIYNDDYDYARFMIRLGQPENLKGWNIMNNESKIQLIKHFNGQKHAKYKEYFKNIQN